MPTDKRRADARRRAWGRGPMILRFEPLESRELLSTATTAVTPSTAALPDLVGQSFQTPTDLNWGSSFQAQGVVVNQGNAPATKPFQVDIYASATPVVDPKANAVLLGVATIPAGLAPGGQSAFNTPLTLPALPLNGLGPSGSFYVAMVIDPQHVIPESNTANNADTGAGFDYTLVSPPTAQAAALIGSGLTVSTSQTDWGGSFSLTQQISNNGTSDAPATRALVVLTPSGGSTDVTIGSISVPSIPVGQSVTVNPTITLPSAPPAALAGATRFTLSIVQDGDYLTNAMYPHSATQGRGLDQAALTITTPSFVSTATGARPALGVSGVSVDSGSVKWGQSFQVGATVQNTGSANPGPFRVRYLLVGSDGTLNNALFLGDSTVNSLAAGASQTIETSLKLPATLPAGATLNSLGAARVAVVVDPEHTLNESTASTAAVSGLIQLQVAGTTSAVVSPSATPKTKSTTPPKTVTHANAPVTPKPAKAPKRAGVNKFTTKSVEHNLKVFPRNFANYVKGRFKF